MNNLSSTDYAIYVDQLTKRFCPPKGLLKLFSHSNLKQPVNAVSGVDLKIDKSELFGLLGPNGAGKTTLIKMLCTLIAPTSGTAFINGYDVVQQEHLVRQSIGLVGSEERSFYWRLSARDNLEFFATLYGLSGRKMSKRISEVIDLVGLGDHADRMFQTYSTGMKQKMCVARGLLTDPAVLFLDEPTRSVDPLTAEHIRMFIKETLVRDHGRTVVLTTHRLEEAEQVCDRIAIMDNGRILACGSMDELRTILRTPCEYELITGKVDGKLSEQLKKLPHADNMQIHVDASGCNISFVSHKGGSALASVIRLLTESGINIHHCRSEEASLERLFAGIVKKGIDGTND